MNPYYRLVKANEYILQKEDHKLRREDSQSLKAGGQEA